MRLIINLIFMIIMKNFASFYDLLLQVQDDDIYFDFDKDEDTYMVVNKQIIPLFTPLEK